MNATDGNVIGFVGLGVMGMRMAQNLIDAGYKVCCYDIREDAMEALERYGALRTSSPSELSYKSGIVICMLPNTSHVEQVIFGEAGLLDSEQNPELIIDMSTISPLAAQRFGNKLKEMDISFIDAPVSGGN